MRKTKIVCTIGPASDSVEMITKLCKAGMNVARLNFSHNTHEYHKATIDKIKQVRETLGLPIAIMLDTKGPEYRIGVFKDNRVTLKDGDKFTLTSKTLVGDKTRVSVNYTDLAKELTVGDTVLLNDGLLKLKVTAVKSGDIETEVVIGGELRNRKSMSFPGKVLKQKYLSDTDKSDIIFGIENGVDYIACSFVSRKQDLMDIHALLKKYKAENSIELIAKIENQSGIDNIDDICKACDGIMVARGDLGVEIPFKKLPAIQKHLITKCRILGKRVITATEMLESMIEKPRPTRAEISDVANAVYDGTSAVMLSGETAMGKHPVEAVETMAMIAETTEESIDYKRRFYHTDFKIKNTVDAISRSTCGMAIDIDAKAIVACSISGKTARMISRFRAPVDIIGLTTEESTWRRLSLSWGVIPVMSEHYPSTEVLFYTAKKLVAETLDLKKGDKMILTAGKTTGQTGGTDLIYVDEI